MGDKHALLFLGVTPFGCPESFTVGTPPDIGELVAVTLYFHPLKFVIAKRSTKTISEILQPSKKCICQRVSVRSKEVFNY